MILIPNLYDPYAKSIVYDKTSSQNLFWELPEIIDNVMKLKVFSVS